MLSNPLFWILCAAVLVAVLMLVIRHFTKKGEETLDEGEQTDVKAFMKDLKKKANEPPPVPAAAGADTLLGATPKLPTDDTSATVVDVVVPTPAATTAAEPPKAADVVVPAPAATTAAEPPKAADVVAAPAPEKVEPKPAEPPKVDVVKPAIVVPAKVTAKVEPAPKPVIDKPAQRTEPQPELETVTVVEDELPAWLIVIVGMVAFCVVWGVFFS